MRSLGPTETSEDLEPDDPRVGRVGPDGVQETVADGADRRTGRQRKHPSSSIEDAPNQEPGVVVAGLGDGPTGDEDGDANREHERDDVDTRLLGRVLSTGLVEERELVRPAEHGAHEEEHESRCAELSAVPQDRERDEGLGVDVPFPQEEGRDEETAEDKEEDDAPV